MAKGHKKETTPMCGCSNSGIGRIRQMNGGLVAVHHDNEKAAEIQGARADNILELLYNELHEFHKKLERKDREIEKIVTNCYKRNESQMERIDKLIGIIMAQNEMIIKHDEKNQARAEALMRVIEKEIQ